MAQLSGSTEVKNQTVYDVNTEYLDTRSRSAKLTVVVTLRRGRLIGDLYRSCQHRRAIGSAMPAYVVVETDLTDPERYAVQGRGAGHDRRGWWPLPRPRRRVGRLRG
jgi:hypothetical protein